jgi:hypothetical protein
VRFGILAHKFVTILAHYDRESSAQLSRQIDGTEASNNFVVETAVDWGIFNDGSGTAIPLLSSSQSTVFGYQGCGEVRHISLEGLRSYYFYCVMP